MNLRLEREASRFNATVGRLLIDGQFECYVLEDTVRERPGVAVATWKIDKQTAIPAGTYRVVITWSTRFKRNLPLLVDVPGFSGIRIHSGNTHENTEGCLLPGRTRGTSTVGESVLAFDALYVKLVTALLAGEYVSITIVNPTPAATAVVAA